MARRFRFPPFVPALALLIAVFPRPGAAGDQRGEAEKLIRHGVELRRTHDDEAAQREFQKAYDLVHTPRAAGQLGLAEQALGRWEDAQRHVGEAIHAPDDPWVAKNRLALDEAMSTIEAHLGRVEVLGDPEGAQVLVDAREVGKLPLSEAVRVSAGQVDVELRAPGYVAAQRTVTIVGGQYQRVVIHLVKETAAAAPPEPVVAPAPIANPKPDLRVSAPDQPSGSNARSVVKWTAAGLAGAGLVTGVVFTILHSQNDTKFTNDGCYNRNGVGVDKNGVMQSSCQSTLGSLVNDRTALIVGYAAAGAFAATWLVLQLTESSSSPGAPAEHAARVPLCLPAGAGVSCSLRF